VKVQSYVIVENKERPFVAGIGTCASSNIIARSHVPDGSLVMPTSDPKIKGANCGSLQVVGIVVLYMRLGEMEPDVPMYVSAYLPTPLLLGASFINRYIREIALYAGVIHLLDGFRILLLHRVEKAAVARVAHRTYIPPMSETGVRCKTSRCGLSQLLPSPKRKDGSVVVSHGIVDSPDGTVDIKIANFRNQPKMLPRNMVVAVVSSVASISTVDEPEQPSVESWMDTVNLSHLSAGERAKVHALLRKYSVLLDGTDLGPMVGPLMQSRLENRHRATSRLTEQGRMSDV
jgi:hypothetical protein